MQQNRAQTQPKPRPGATSPGKQRNNTGNGPLHHSHTEVPEQFVVLDRDLVRGLSEKEVEIEHLRTQLVAYQEKAEVLEDMRKDVQAQREMLRGSEDRRYEL